MKQFISAVRAIVIVGASLTAGWAQNSDSLSVKILPDLVVTASSSSADPIHIINRNAFGSTEDLLEKLGGLSMIRRGAYGEEPVIRGLGSGQINVTVDGMRMFGACTDRMDPVTSYLDATNLSGVDGITDITASAFGSTFGGSVNMTLWKPRLSKEKISGVAGVRVGSSAGSTTTYGVVNASRKASAFRISATHRRAQNYRSGGGAEVNYSQYEKVQIGAAGKWATGSYDTLTAEVILDDGWNIGFPALPMDVGVARARIFAVTFERTDPWWKLQNLEVKGYHNRVSHTMDDSARPDVVIPMDMPGSNFTSGLFAEGDVHVFHQHATMMKMEYFTNTSGAEMIMYPAEGTPMYMQSAPTTTTRTAGYYLQQQINLTGKDKLLLTFRTDLVSQRLHGGTGRSQWEVLAPHLPPQTNEFVKSGGMSYSGKPSANTLVKVQAGYGERAPSNTERYGYYLFNRFDGFDYIGNPFLRKESALNAEGTFKWFWQRVELDVTPYSKWIDNYVFSSVQNDLSTMTPGARGVKRYTNIRQATISGVDAVILAQPFRSVQWICTLKYTRGKTSAGEYLPMMPPLKISSFINYVHGKFGFYADVEYGSAQHRVSESFGEEETPSFWIAGLRAGWKQNESWTINIGVENIFDRKYREHLDWGGIPRPGRNIFIDLRFKY